MASSGLSPMEPEQSSQNYGATFNEKTPLLASDGASPIASHVGGNNVEKSDGRSKDANNFSFSRLSSKSKYTLLLCSIANLFVGCSFSILGPFFPKEAENKGVSTTVVGLIFSMFEFVIFISSPLFGLFMSQIGPKFMFASGICVGGSCSILFGLLDKCPPGDIFVVMCFSCRCIEALALSAFITASFAILSNEFPKHIATVIGISETASGIGMMIGPAIGGALYELAGYGAPFFVMGGLIILIGMLLFTFMPVPRDVNQKRKGSVFALLFSPLVLISMMSVVICSLGISFLDPTLANHLDQFKLSTGVVGLMFVIGPGLYAAFSPLWGYLVDSKERTGSLIVPGHLLFGISLLLIGPSPLLPFLPNKLWVIIIGSMVLGLSVGCAVVPNMKCLVQGALDVGFEDNLDTYGIVSGMFNSMFCLGAFSGPTIGGFLVDHYGFDVTSTIIGLVSILGSIISFIFFFTRHMRHKKKKQSDEATISGEADANTQVSHVQSRDVEVHSPVAYSVEIERPMPTLRRMSSSYLSSVEA